MFLKLGTTLIVVLSLIGGYFFYFSENFYEELIPEIYIGDSILEEDPSLGSLMSNYSFSPLEKGGFSYLDKETNETTQCTYIRKYSNGNDIFPLSIFICESNDAFDYYFPSQSYSDENNVIYNYLGDIDFGFIFNDTKNLNRILNSNNDEIIYQYDRRYSDPLTIEGDLAYLGGIVDTVYKGDLLIQNHVFELNPELTLFSTPLTSKLGPMAESLVSSKAAGASLGCLLGGAVGAGLGLLADIVTFGLTGGAGTVGGAAAGCVVAGSIGKAVTPDYDRRHYCAIYRDNNRQDYAVCQTWEKNTKLRSDKFDGVLREPILGKLTIYQDHLEIDFIGDEQIVSFLY
tara:strand:+ start:187 stop:1218 length:1032 start_codon:yes stop_codon:yes gene_type:complete